MAQILFPDFIKPLTFAAGTITLPATSYLTIGGQQYVISSNLNFSVGSPTANTLYFLYAYVSGGIVSLTMSTSANSVGPGGGITSWKLVGAFMANGNASPAFGSFVNIVGTPQTDWIPFVPTTQNWTLTIPSGYYRINGRTCEYELNCGFSGTPVGSGVLIINAPFTHDTSRIAGSAFGDETVGVSSLTNFGVEEWEGNVTPIGTGGFEPRVQRTSSASAGTAIDQTLQFTTNPPPAGLGTITSNWAFQIRTVPIPTTGNPIFTLNELRSL